MPSHMKRRSMDDCVGKHCKGCASPSCMAEGGAVDSGKQRADNERGINKANEWRAEEGQSEAGTHARNIEKYGPSPSERVYNREQTEEAKDKHYKVLGQMRFMKKPHGEYSKGGPVSLPDVAGDREGHRTNMPEKPPGSPVTPDSPDYPYTKPSPSVAPTPSSIKVEDLPMSEGGEVGDDEELHNAMGEELMGAFERKDKKAIMDCLHACVSSMMNKEHD